MFSGCALPWAARLCAAASLVSGAIAAGFSDPERIYRPKFRYWLPDASVPAEAVSKDIHSLADAGAGGLEYLPFYLYGLASSTLETVPPTNWSEYGFGTPASNALFKSALQAAADAGVVMDFAVGASEGQGIPSEPMTPGLAVQLLLGNVTLVGGQAWSGPVPSPGPISSGVLNGMGFMHPLEQFGTPNLTAVIALKVVRSTPRFGSTTTYLDESSFVDLTNATQNGNLNWTVPAGNSTWRLFSIWEGYTNERSVAGGYHAATAVGNGSWVVDHFSQAGAKKTTDFWDEIILSDPETAKLLSQVGHYAWEDSMEIMATLYWTPGFLDRFEKQCGYNLVKYIPTLFTANGWNGGHPYSESFMYGNTTLSGESIHQMDYRAVLNSGYQDYINQFVDWAHSRGVQYSNQPAYNLPLEMLSDIPLDDAPEGESLGFSSNMDVYRQFRGPAHLSGRNVISTEVGAVFNGAYSMSVPSMLSYVKGCLAGGFTMSVIHGSPYSGDYANTTWPGYTTFQYQVTEMWNSNVPSWLHIKDSLDYIGRTQWVIQQGVPKVDLAIYMYGSPWQARTQYSSTNLENLGFSYDYLGPDNLLLTQVTVNNSVLAPDGPAYKALILNNEDTITLAAADALTWLAQQGLPILVIGNPHSQVHPATQDNLDQLQEKMRGLMEEPNIHRLPSVDGIPTFFADWEIRPQASLSCTVNPVYTIWRSDAKSSTEYVLFYNHGQVAGTCNITVTASAGIEPWVYDAYTGNQSSLVQYNITSRGIQFVASLNSLESLIIALKPEATNNTRVASSNGITSLQHRSGGGILAARSGPAELTMASGTTHSFVSALPPLMTLAAWDITIEDWQPTANLSSVETAVTVHSFANQTLVPWTQLAGMQNVSGVGRYATNFTVPPAAANTTLGALLSFGPVANTLRARIDGAPLPPVDPARPVLDVSAYLRPGGGAHALEVEVTSTLFNRVKALAGQISTFEDRADTGGPYVRDAPQQYGLLGPVTLQWLAIEELP